LYKLLLLSGCAMREDMICLTRLDDNTNEISLDKLSSEPVLVFLSVFQIQL